MYVLEFAGDHDRLAALEAASVASGVERVGTGIATAGAVADVERLAFTRRVARLVGHTDADVDSARALLAAAPVDRTGSVAVRARDVRKTAGVDTQRAERVLGQVLVDRGFSVDLDDPDHVLLALFAGGVEDEGGIDGVADADAIEYGPDLVAEDAPDSVCALGWLTAESSRNFADDPTDRPFFQPGSMDPMLARALANLAGAAPGRRILDPMCGTGGVLIEAGLVGADVVGMDAQAKMVRGARENLAHYLSGGWAVCRGDATRLPFRDHAFDGAVFDAPYGRQSAIAADSVESLVAGALESIRAVAPRVVVVGDRSWAAVARGAGWSVEATVERRVHRSLTRHVVVCSDATVSGSIGGLE